MWQVARIVQCTQAVHTSCVTLAPLLFQTQGKKEQHSAALQHSSITNCAAVLCFCMFRAGKSSILQAILSKMITLEGRVDVGGTIAYVPQTPWVQNLSLRDNILFGMPYDGAKYKAVIHACALELDLKILPNGEQRLGAYKYQQHNRAYGTAASTGVLCRCPAGVLHMQQNCSSHARWRTTAASQSLYQWCSGMCCSCAGDASIAGERGINLSGGQRQRVCLARAAYHDAQLVLLDNPLSAVDQHTSKHIFDKCIKGLLVNKAVVLVAHQLELLPQVRHREGHREA